MSRGVIFLVLSLAANRGLAAVDEIIRPKVVVVTMFEPGQDTGDAPGELQYWVEREQLTRVLPLPAAYHDVRSNADGSVIGIVTGVGNSNAAASIMALGLDPRFDLRASPGSTPPTARLARRRGRSTWWKAISDTRLMPGKNPPAG